MPRRSRGLGAGSQGPLRGISNLIKNLPAGQQDRLRAAFVDAEDLLTFHSQSQPEKQTKRKISGLVRQIDITAVSSILGGFVSWSRSDDPRIAFYELELSDNNVFSSVETYQVLDTFLSIDGITNRKFVRVRAVRLDGETGIWSDTASISPNTVAPRAHSISFYTQYFSPDSDPNTQRTITFGGGLDPQGVQSFYTLLSNSFYIDRLSGGISIWGYVSNRLEKFTNAGVTPWDRVRFTVNGIHRLDNYYPHWTNAFSIDGANRTDFVNFYPNELISFYSRGGYTAAFGPYAVSIPNTLSGVGPNDPNKVTAQDSTDGTFYWNYPFNARYPSRFDQAQTDAFNDTSPYHEAASLQIDATKKTHWIIFQDFKFDLPDNSIISGIKAEVKRRQPNLFNDEISTNYGVVRSDKNLGHNLVVEYKGTVGTGATNVSKGNILQDVNFGKYLDLAVGKSGVVAHQSGRLVGDPSGIGDNGTIPADSRSQLITNADNWTISTWFTINSAAVNSLVPTTQDLVSLTRGNAPGSGVIFIDMFISINTSTNVITTYTGLVRNLTGGAADSVTFATTSAPLTGAFNAFHHMAISFSRVNNRTLTLYIDGVQRSTTSLSDILFSPALYPTSTLCLGIGTFGGTVGLSICGQSEVAIWDKTLLPREVLSIYRGRGGVDLRENFDEYQSSNKLNHYFLHFPTQADIQDQQIRLVDLSGIRFDLDNKAITTESWPQLGQFFYTNIRQCEILPQAVADGIPHDNHLAIGYQGYGDEFDLWGAPEWTASEVNDFYFGLAIQAINSSNGIFKNSAFIDHAKLTIFTVPEADREITISVSASSANQFYLERSLWGGLINGIEIGEQEAEVIE